MRNLPIQNMFSHLFLKANFNLFYFKKKSCKYFHNNYRKQVKIPFEESLGSNELLNQYSSVIIGYNSFRINCMIDFKLDKICIWTIKVNLMLKTNYFKQKIICRRLLTVFSNYKFVKRMKETLLRLI